MGKIELLNLLTAAAWLNSRLTSNGRKRCEVRIKRHKADKRDRHGKHRYKDAANKQEGKQAKQQINK